MATLAAGAAGVATAALTSLAAAASPTTLGTATTAMLGETIVVDSHGATVYELRPETTHHLLCTKANGCFQIWRPLEVGSAKARLTAARGVTGKLGTLHRHGLLQVTLGGHPLYRFVGDAGKGSANGQGIHTFHGTWHVVTATAPAGTTPGTTPSPTVTMPTTPTTTTPTTPYYPPGY